MWGRYDKYLIQFKYNDTFSRWLMVKKCNLKSVHCPRLTQITPLGRPNPHIHSPITNTFVVDLVDIMLILMDDNHDLRAIM